MSIAVFFRRPHESESLLGELLSHNKRQVFIRGPGPLCFYQISPQTSLHTCLGPVTLEHAFLHIWQRKRKINVPAASRVLKGQLGESKNVETAEKESQEAWVSPRNWDFGGSEGLTSPWGEENMWDLRLHLAWWEVQFLREGNMRIQGRESMKDGSGAFRTEAVCKTDCPLLVRGPESGGQ